MDRGRLVYEDLSPILKENQSSNLIDRFDGGNRLKNLNNNNENDSDDTKNLITHLSTVNINSGDSDDYQTACSETETKNDGKDVCKKKNDCKSFRKIRGRSSQKENIDGEMYLIGELKKPKVNPTKTASKKKKKKDSFIVSDNSSISNDSITVYHQVLSRDIQTDVRKMTPRPGIRKCISRNDDGIFTPYIFGKRSSSESSFSDDSETDNCSKKLKQPLSQIRPPLFANQKSNGNTSEDDDTNACERNAVSGNNSSSLFSTSQPKIKNRASVTTVSSVLGSRNLKDLSCIFTDDDSSDTGNNENVNFVPSVRVIRDDKPGTSADKKLLSKEKPGQSNEKVTPITYRLKKVKNLTPKTNKYEEDEPLSFLKSLSTFTSPHELHPDAERYKKKFKKTKEELAVKLFKIFNEQVFKNELPSDLKIEWSARLRSSSGLCYNRRIKTVIGPNNECLRSSRIALSTKIIETPDRLRDTLIHEMCHAAAWIIDNKCDGHGPRWRAWAAKAMRTFPELPTIRRCHDYAVKTKFSYRCVKCSYTIGRHSKSLNLDRKRCGYCYGKFELLVNHEKAAKSNISRTSTSPKNVKARPLSKFALFVKENYGKIKSEMPDLKHGDIMRELSRNFASTKISSS